VVKTLTLLALLLTGVSSSAGTPLCRAEVVLEPARAFVGQPVLHRVRIEQQRDVLELRWETSLSFPALRAEPLLGPGGPPERSATTQTTEERRVLFPARAGRLRLPPARIACESADRIESAEVPAAELLAEEPPLEGRPAGWSGLIGPVEIAAYATPDRVALGESVSISVTVRGATNVWAAPITLAGAFPPDVAELFERPPELARDMGRELVLRSYRSFDLVPRRAGALVIPELRVPYFDPTTGRYAEARTPALALEVSGRRDPGAMPPPDEPAARRQPAGSSWLLAAGVASGLALGFWLGLARRGRRHARRGAGPEEQAGALLTLRAALASGDATAAAAAAARLLRFALEPELPGARTLAAEELAGRAPRGREPTLALLLALEGARFRGGDPAALLALAREAEALGR